MVSSGEIVTGRAIGKAAPFTNLVVLASAAAAVIMALSLSLPWYQVTVENSSSYWYLTYETEFYFDFASWPNGMMVEYEFEGAMQEVMDIEKAFVYAWICLVLVFMGLAMLDGRYSSMAVGPVLTAVAIAALLFFAVKIEDAADEVMSWGTGSDGTVTKSAGTGLILALVAFVGQSIAIVLRARYVLPWIAEDIRLNRARAGGKNV
jgi:threonine/homoserine efflux transporter RhtA